MRSLCHVLSVQVAEVYAFSVVMVLNQRCGGACKKDQQPETGMPADTDVSHVERITTNLHCKKIPLDLR